MSKKYGGVDTGANLEKMQEAYIIGETKETPLSKHPIGRIIASWAIFTVVTYFLLTMILAASGMFERPDVSYWFKIVIPLLPTLVRTVYAIQIRFYSKRRMKNTSC